MNRPISQRAFLYYTANVIHESFANSVRDHLTNLAVQTNSIIISVSQKPIDFGLNICVGEMGRSAWLVYWQILKGAYAARKLNIPWIYCCEDDSLYNLEHLASFVPSKDVFYYNMNRWILELHDKKACFRWRDRISMCGCIVSTDLMIKTLETKFERFPDPITERYDPRLRGWGEPGRYEWYLNLPRVEMTYFRTDSPIITFNHKMGLGGFRKVKEKDIIKEILEPWGKAQTIWDRYHG